MVRFLLPALLLCASSAGADDWPQFRGPSGTGVSAGPEAPVEWGPGKNVRWRTPVDGTGSSSPVISRGRVYVTVATEKGRKRSLLCLDRKTALDAHRGRPGRAHAAGQSLLRIDAVRGRRACRGLACVGRPALLRRRRKAPLVSRPRQGRPHVGLRVVPRAGRQSRPGERRTGGPHVPGGGRQEGRRSGLEVRRARGEEQGVD